MASVGAALSISVKLLNEAKADLARLEKDLDGVGDVAKKSSGSLSKMSGALGDMAKIAGGFVIAQGLLKLPGLIGGMSAAASDTAESLSKVRVVFGESASGIEAFAKTAATSLGISNQSALSAAGTFGNLFRAMGLGQQPAADMSKSILTLAADLASFNNMDPTEVLEKLRAGLVGEAEPMRALGVNINETTVKAQALAMGFKEVNGTFTDAEKIQARYALIMAQTTLAQGDFTKTADGAANQLRILKARQQDLSAHLGESFLPIQIAVQKFMLDKLVPALQVAAEWFGPKFKAALELAAVAVPHVIDALASFLNGFVRTVDGVTAGVDLLVRVFSVAMTGILDIVSEVGQAIYAALQWLNPFAEHSPSLVSQVQAGAVAITEAYATMGNATGQLATAGVAVGSLAAAFGDMTAKVLALADDRIITAVSKLGGGDAVDAYRKAQQAVADLGGSYLQLGKDIAKAEGEVDKIRRALDTAKDAFERFSRASIAEALPFTKAAKDLAYQIAQIQLEIVKAKQLGPLTMQVTTPTGKVDKDGKAETKTTTELTAAGKLVEALEAKLAKLQLQADKIRLEETLKIGPLKDQIDALTDSTEQLPFDVIIKGLRNAKADVEKLTPALAIQTGQLDILKTEYKTIGDQLIIFQRQVKTVTDEAVKQFDAMAKAAGGGAGGGAAGALAALTAKAGETTGEGSPLGQASKRIEDMAKSFDKLKESMGDTRDKLQPLTEKLGEAAKWFATNKELLIALAAVGGIYVGVLISLQAAIGIVTVVTWLVVGAQTAWNIAMSLNPIGLIVIAIVALVAGIFLLVKNWDNLTDKYPVLKAFSDKTVDVFKAIQGKIKDLIDFVKDHWDDIMKAIEPVMDAIKVLIDKYIAIWKGLFQVFMGVFTGDWQRAWDGVKAIVTAIMDGIKGAIDLGITAIKNLAPLMLSAGKALGGALFDGIKSAVSDVAGFAQDIAAVIGAAIKNLINTQIIDRFNRAMEFTIKMPTPIPDFHVNPPDIPYLAHGGIVTRPTLAVIGEAGPEAIIPLSRAGAIGGGNTYNITIQALDAASFDEFLRRGNNSAAMAYALANHNARSFA